jgi:cell division protein FtsI/penicillin-binding protein 2
MKLAGLLVAALAISLPCLAAFIIFYENLDYSLIELEISDLEVSTEQQDSILVKSVKTMLNRYHPPNAFILLMDAKSGNILAWGQRENDNNSEEPTFLQRDSFPAASLAKIVTAVAALENEINPNSKFPKIGRNSTLYKKQIFPAENYKGNTITLEEAFAKSNNPAMGIIGMGLGKDKLEATAQKLGFLNFNYSDSSYELAESSCGFTQRNMVSPLQVASAVRKLLIQSPENFKKRTYKGMQTLFLKTITDGTAKKKIKKSVYSYNMNSLYIGGKTGSLDGDFPAGRYDWFAGFAQSKKEPEKVLIVVVMQVHEKLRYQHSTIIAGLLINEWAKRVN